MKARLFQADLPRCQLGEGPVWHRERQVLSWIDIDGGAIHEYYFEGARHQQIAVVAPVGFALPVMHPLHLGTCFYVAGIGPDIVRVSPDGATYKLAGINMPAQARWNDAQYDPWGNLWCGTMSLADPKAPVAALYRYDGHKVEPIREGLRLSNGLGWSPDHTLMYHAETARQQIMAYRLNPQGHIIDDAVFADLGPDKPDGLCVDARGHIYCAIFGGGCVRIFDAEGKPAGQIEVPTPNVTSCAIGGPALDQLFITTAQNGQDQGGGAIYVGDLAS